MNLLTYTELLMNLQYNFNKSICDKIYKVNSNHLYEKWLTCNGNLLNFINRLDSNNRLLLIDYVITTMYSKE